MYEERQYRGGETEKGQLVMPFYLTCDVSISMTNDMAALNDGLVRLRRKILADPLVNDVAYIAITTFSDIAKVVMPLGRMSEHPVPVLSPESGTNYGAAFRMLAQTIAQDTADLKARQFQVYRPCVFFLTDGEPLDSDWQQTFVNTLTYDPATRTGMKGHPIFVPFGFRDAPEKVLRKLAYPMDKAKWYHSRDNDVEETLQGIIGVIMQTVVTAGRTPGTGNPAIVQQAPAANTGLAWGDPDGDFL
jgi:uncharacterized protein YegL